MPSIRRTSIRLSPVVAPRTLRFPPALNGKKPDPLCTLTAPCDEAAQFWIGWFRRAHRHKQYEVRALKRVDCLITHADGRTLLDGQGRPVSRRYVWEVAKPKAAKKTQWLLITWGVDDVAVWFQSFPTLRAAMSAYRQPPGPVRDIAERIAEARKAGARDA